MTVVKLAKGGLLVYGPVSPTEECINQVRSLERQYGEVKYIILPSGAHDPCLSLLPLFWRQQSV